MTNNKWIDVDKWKAYKAFKDMRRAFAWKLFFGDTEEIKEDKESFYFVNLSNGKENTLGHKSRTTGKIYLSKDDYDIDLTRPIENTDFEYVRDSTPFDL